MKWNIIGISSVNSKCYSNLYLSFKSKSSWTTSTDIPYSLFSVFSEIYIQHSVI